MGCASSKPTQLGNARSQPGALGRPGAKAAQLGPSGGGASGQNKAAGAAARRKSQSGEEDHQTATLTADGPVSAASGGVDFTDMSLLETVQAMRKYGKTNPRVAEAACDQLRGLWKDGTAALPLGHLQAASLSIVEAMTSHTADTAVAAQACGAIRSLCEAGAAAHEHDAASESEEEGEGRDPVLDLLQAETVGPTQRAKMCVEAGVFGAVVTVLEAHTSQVPPVALACEACRAFEAIARAYPKDEGDEEHPERQDAALEAVAGLMELLGRAEVHQAAFSAIDTLIIITELLIIIRCTRRPSPRSTTSRTSRPPRRRTPSSPSTWPRGLASERRARSRRTSCWRCATPWRRTPSPSTCSRRRCARSRAW